MLRAKYGRGAEGFSSPLFPSLYLEDKRTAMLGVCWPASCHVQKKCGFPLTRHPVSCLSQSTELSNNNQSKPEGVARGPEGLKMGAGRQMRPRAQSQLTNKQKV